VKNVRALRGTCRSEIRVSVLSRPSVLLSPENTQVLGYRVDHLEAEQSKRFVDGLLRRMGKPIPIDEGQEAAHISPDVAPVRGIPPLPPRQDTGRHGARRQPIHSPSPPPVIRPDPRRITQREPKMSARAAPPAVAVPRLAPRSARAASRQAAARLEAMYDQPFPVIDDDDDDDDDEMIITHSHHFPKQSHSRPAAVRQHQPSDDYDFDMDDSFIRLVDEVEQRASGRQQAYEIDNEDDDEFEVDDSSMRHVEEVEARVGKRPRMVESDDEKENREVIEISD